MHTQQLLMITWIGMRIIAGWEFLLVHQEEQQHHQHRPLRWNMCNCIPAFPARHPGGVWFLLRHVGRFSGYVVTRAAHASKVSAVNSKMVQQIVIILIEGPSHFIDTALFYDDLIC